VTVVTAYVALLRGIAPSNPRMRNDALRDVFERAGLERVRTVISSGNLLFDSTVTDRDALEGHIEDALEDHLGAPCTTIVRSHRQVSLLAGLDVFDGYDDGPTERCNVTFLKRPRSASSIHVDDAPGARVVAVRNQAVFTVIDTTTNGTPAVMRTLERICGPEITTRTWRTVHRVLDALRDDSRPTDRVEPR
jgi:uncharacterized protein (DUF1697 family)